MVDLCGNIPDDAKKIITEKCRVVNLCIFLAPTSEISVERICEQLKVTSKIWCSCGIMFNIQRFRRLNEIVNNPDDYRFTADAITSANNVLDTPQANNLWNLNPCCTDGPHVNLYYIGGTEFQSGESGVGKFQTSSTGSGNYFILIADGANDPEVLAHELGHVLGLGHSSDPNNLMHPNPPGTEILSEQCEVALRSALIQEQFTEVGFIPEFPKRFEVEFINMKVFEVDDGADPDDDIEIRWNFTVSVDDGTSSPQPPTVLSWEHHKVEDDSPNVPYHIGRRTVVSIENVTDKIKIGVSGIEFDDNPLPTDSKEFDKLSNWGASFSPNPAFHLTNDEISCELAFKVTELPGEQQPIPSFCQNAVIH